MTLRTRSRKIVKKRVRLGLSPAYRQAGARSALFFALFMPMITHAAVQITEVMYDPPGANAGGQWLEVTNVDSVAISIAVQNHRRYNKSQNICRERDVDIGCRRKRDSYERSANISHTISKIR